MGNIGASEKIYKEFDIHTPQFNQNKDMKQFRILGIDNRNIDRINTLENNLMTVFTKNGNICKDISVIIPSVDIKDQLSEKESSMCIFCLDRGIKTAIVDCGHVCLCVTCLRSIVLQGNGMCPQCRCPIRRAINIYLN